MMWSFKKKNVFHGHDLNKWNYLGSSEIKFTDDGIITRQSYIYYFVHNETDKRSYHCSNKYMKMHQFISHYSELWKIGETSLFEIILDKPSKYCIKLAADTGYKFDYNNTCWIKFLAPTKTTDNVIKVDFK